MRVQEIRTSDYQKRYVVVDGNGNLVVPVVRYLKYLNAIGRARNTLRCSPPSCIRGMRTRFASESARKNRCMTG